MKKGCTKLDKRKETGLTRVAGLQNKSPHTSLSFENLGVFAFDDILLTS